MTNLKLIDKEEDEEELKDKKSLELLILKLNKNNQNNNNESEGSEEVKTKKKWNEEEGEGVDERDGGAGGEEEEEESNETTSKWQNNTAEKKKLSNLSSNLKTSVSEVTPEKPSSSNVENHLVDTTSCSSSSSSIASYTKRAVKNKKTAIKKRNKKIKNEKKIFKIISTASEDPLEDDEEEDDEEDEENSKNVIKVLKEFYVETSYNAFGLLMSVLKSYSLGPLDDLKCILCCIEKVDLSGFIERHKRQSGNKCTTSTTSNDVFLNTNGNKFCNSQKLENVAKYVSLFNPFCDEYCKTFYPNCIIKPLNSSNMNNNSSNNNTDKIQQQQQNIEVKNKEDHLKNCKPYFPPPPIQNLTEQFINPSKNNINNNNSISSITDKKSFLKTSTLLIDQNNIDNSPTYDNLIGCLKGFDLTNAQQKYENSKKTILNFQNLSSKTSSLFKTKCLSNDLLKYKPMPICRDSNGNLILNIDLNKSLSKRAHNLTKTIISNRNLKISNSK